MCQSGNNVAWRLIALLSILSIGISLFTIWPTPTYAVRPSLYNLQIFVLRPTSSTVGSVRFSDVDNDTLGKGCLSLSEQNSLTALGAYPNLDHILIENFPDGNCSAQGFPNTADNVLAPTYKIGTSYQHNCCRLYTTPAQA